MNTKRVLVVEDSLVFREFIVQIINEAHGLEVVATAGDPFEARDAIIEYQPDVMTLDIELPRMNGVEFLKRLMPQYPIPVVMISSYSDKIFEALSAGAVDFVVKPGAVDFKKREEFFQRDLVNKVRMAACVNGGKQRGNMLKVTPQNERLQKQHLVVAIGASTGGTEAIASVMKEFNTDIPGIVIVQHMPEGFTKMYAERLDNQCKVSVKEAKTGDVIRPGQALLAPGGDAHMEVVKVNGQYQVIIKRGPKVNGHCPSVDVLFDSVADVVGKNALGIILTGMGGDGAKGLLKMRQAGARTIGQDESSCIVYGMPKVAYELGAVEFQEKLADIPRKTYQVLNKM